MYAEKLIVVNQKLASNDLADMKLQPQLCFAKSIQMKYSYTLCLQSFQTHFNEIIKHG